MAKTRKNRSFDKDVTIAFFEMLLMVKLFHWNTHSFATHKATDELYTSLNTHMDKFIEVHLGATGSRINMSGQKTVNLWDLKSPTKLKAKIEAFKQYLTRLPIDGTDLMNIRDEILGDLNQFSYLLTLS
jgi:DNA-binding ferritin-like protein